MLTLEERNNFHLDINVKQLAIGSFSQPQDFVTVLFLFSFFFYICNCIFIVDWSEPQRFLNCIMVPFVFFFKWLCFCCVYLCFWHFNLLTSELV